jgi:uroporphyrin-III C-methyltransferase
VTVYLVGAGPGDPDLLTVRGLRLLERADAVLYDRLAGVQPMLDLINPRADVRSVGKQGGGPSWPQEQINELLVDMGRRLETVVRLKGGDPFVFGRGAEELAALRAAGIDAQVVPGVSSATGVPTSAGIALTERGISHAFTVVTGHTAPWASVVNWRAVSAIGGTIVVLMGGGAMTELSEELQVSGLSRDTPVAVICDGSRPHQQVLRTTLEGLANVSGLPSSPTIVIGAVAAEALPPGSDH